MGAFNRSALVTVVEPIPGGRLARFPGNISIELYNSTKSGLPTIFVNNNSQSNVNCIVRYRP
jgi:hypothetical protein